MQLDGNEGGTLELERTECVMDKGKFIGKYEAKLPLHSVSDIDLIIIYRDSELFIIYIYYTTERFQISLT